MGKLNQGRLNDSNPSRQFLFALADTLNEDPHITDAELIEWAAGVMDDEPAARLQSHIGHCKACAAESEAMNTCLTGWADAGAMVRREARIGRPQVMNPGYVGAPSPPATGEAGESPWWSFVAGWAPLASLRPLGAMAAGIDTAFVTFPIYDQETIVIGLSGTVQRRGNEFYVRVSVAPEARDAYRGRTVELAAVEPESGQPRLLRKVGIDQTLLLGTDLQIATHKITARLHP
jgi:hypothetical protein